MGRLRQITFVLFAAGYLVCCPLVLLYAFGYLIRPHAPDALVRTGVLSLATTPPGATVYLGRSRYTGRTPAVLTDLLPGIAHVTLSLKGYRPWRRALPIRAGQATSLPNILLVPESWPSETLLEGPFDALLDIPGAGVCLLTRGRHLQDVTVISTSGRTAHRLAAPGSRWAEARLRSHVIAPRSAFVILFVSTKEGERVLGFDLEADPPAVSDLTALVPRKPDWITWDPGWPGSLFILEDERVSRVDLDAGAVYPSIATGVKGMGAGDRTLTVIRDPGRLERLNARGEPAGPSVPLGPRARALIGERYWWRVIDLEEALLLFGEQGALVSLRPAEDVIRRGARGVRPSRRLARALVWDRERIGLVGGETAGSAAATADGMEPARWLFTHGRDIEQVVWAHEESHAVFRDRDLVRLLEMELYGPPRVHDVAELKRHTAFAYDDKSGLLYFLDPERGSLRTILLVPDPGGMSLEFGWTGRNPAPGRIQGE